MLQELEAQSQMLRQEASSVVGQGNLEQALQVWRSQHLLSDMSGMYTHEMLHCSCGSHGSLSVIP